MKKDCDQYAEDLSALIDGELSAKWRAEIEAHVAGCADCRARVAELRQLSAGVAALPKMATSPQFLTDVRRKIVHGDEPDVESWWESTIHSLWVLVPVRVAAAVVILLGLVSLFSPYYNSRLDRAQRGQMAKAKAKAHQEPTTTAPVATAAPAYLADSRAAELAKDEAKKLSSEALAADKAETIVETLVVESSDMDQVQAQANQVALALNGRVTTAPPQQFAGRKLANNFYVELPARNARSFREQVLNQYAPAKQRNLDWSRTDNYQQQAPGGVKNEVAEVQQFRSFENVAAALSNEPTSVLEIQVVPPAK